MTEQKIIIPDKVEHSKLLVVLLDPQTSDAQMTFTFEGEDAPFRQAILRRRSREISAFMFRPIRLDEAKREFSEHLKSGDVINVEVTANGKSKNPAKKLQKVIIE